jgi:hypothetical protein
LKRLAGWTLLAISTAASASDAEFLRCRAIKDATARLACYDALPTPSRPDVPPAAAGRSPALETAAPGRQKAEQFGFEQKQEAAAQKQAAASQLATIESHIPGRFEGWHPKKAIRLANGQVWQIADDSSSVIVRESPKVTIRRGFLGSFFLDIEGDNRSPRVRRSQ